MTEEQRCQTCECWESDSLDARWGSCVLIAKNRAQKASIEIEGQGVTGIDFSTARDFGCVEWKAKE